MCTVPKGRSLWPGDLECLPKLAPHGLSEVPSMQVLSCAMAFMFDDMESAIKKVDKGLENLSLEKVPPKDPTEAALHEIRETIQIMFVLAYKKVSASATHQQCFCVLPICRHQDLCGGFLLLQACPRISTLDRVVHPRKAFKRPSGLKSCEQQVTWRPNER